MRSGGRCPALAPGKTAGFHIQDTSENTNERFATGFFLMDQQGPVHYFQGRTGSGTGEQHFAQERH
jgi:hypothetical protein